MSKRAPLKFDVPRVTPSAKPEAKKSSLEQNTQTDKQSRSQTKTVRERGHFIAAHVEPEAAKQFKLLVVQQDSTTQEMLVEAINDLFAKHGLSRIA
jgi:hypothetical protein